MADITESASWIAEQAAAVAKSWSEVVEILGRGPIPPCWQSTRKVLEAATVMNASRRTGRTRRMSGPATNGGRGNRFRLRPRRRISGMGAPPAKSVRAESNPGPAGDAHPAGLSWSANAESAVRSLLRRCWVWDFVKDPTIRSGAALVFRLFGQACIRCGHAGNIHAHHIMPVEEYPELAFEPTNGVPLCGNCHVEILGVTNWPTLTS